MLIEVEDKIVSKAIFDRKFMCDLSKCKGACCVEGDDGAPLEKEEIKIIESILPQVKPYMTAEGIEQVEKLGVYYMDRLGEPVTTLVEDGACAFASFDEDGTAKCALEKAYRAGATKWKKPISCELFPIRTKQLNQYTALNYEDIAICSPGCILGESLNLPVYKFLKEPLIRAFGPQFYQSLETIDGEIQEQNLSE